jgi:hypothetical protein
VPPGGRPARDRASLADPQPSRPHPCCIAGWVSGYEENAWEHTFPASGVDSSLNGAFGYPEVDRLGERDQPVLP